MYIYIERERELGHESTSAEIHKICTQCGRTDCREDFLWLRVRTFSERKVQARGAPATISFHAGLLRRVTCWSGVDTITPSSHSKNSLSKIWSKGWVAQAPFC